MKELCQFFKSFTPMAEAVLLVSGHLGKGPLVTVGNENRVIAESGRPLRDPAYATFCVAEKNVDLSVWKSKGHAANEPGAPLVVRDVREFGKELFIISDIVVARASGVSGGIDPRRAVQGIDFKSGAAGKRGFACALTDLECFFDGVPLKGVPVLHGFRAVREIIEREYRDRQVDRDPSDFFDLLFIARS